MEEGRGRKALQSGKSLDFWVKQQTEAVAAIDEGVGRIVKALEETGQLDNTIIVFTADQGYVWGHHGLKGKIDPYETAIRSPFIVSCPKRFPEGKVCKAPINGRTSFAPSMPGPKPNHGYSCPAGTSRRWS
jgi:hypothetical protein